MKIQFINRTSRRLPLVLMQSDVRRVLGHLNHLKSKVPKFSSLTIIFVRNQDSQRLNRHFLKKNRPASVLAFGYDSEAELILAPAFIHSQARAEGRPYGHELRRMIAHGMLHLAGYHHEASGRQARSFERLERDILGHLGMEKTQHNARNEK